MVAGQRGAMLQAGRPRARIPMRSMDLVDSNRTTALGLTQPLTKTSARNIPERKGRPVRRTDNLTDMYKPIV
jgi:hypothetical protein